MTASDWSTRPRAERELENEFMRQNLRNTDWAVGLALLATVDLREEPQALDLICEVVTLRASGAAEDELQAWGARVRAYLHRLIDGDAPVAWIVN